MDGREGERRAARYLEEQGFRILARNWRAQRAELDLVAEKDGILCFVEVRSRGAGARVGALESVDARKRANLAAAAQAFLRRHRLWDRRARFDVVAIDAAGRVTHVESAFNFSGPC
jgi:putative endonuclease